ncbi:MAG: hypothetical protein ACD_79C01535G0017 [uncultured bacterium]|nr:MAG: hypothetical protein ACD_79C01535G0017 [uncultured bacterium]
MKIHVYSPPKPKMALKYVSNAIRNNCISSFCNNSLYNYVKMLEDSFANYIGVKHATSVTSGTTALHLALKALEIKKNDEIIVPNFTMIATISSIYHIGAKPVFVDADPSTWCIDTNLIEAKITKKTKAIIPVHIYGCSANMTKIRNIARKYNLYIIEDAAEAIGTEYKGKKAGSFGDIACFSFYANKLITSGEGGMLVTNNNEIYEKLVKLKDHFFTKSRFHHEDFGFNYRFNNISAAYAYASFQDHKKNLEKKIQNALYYIKCLSNINGISFCLNPSYIKNSYWMFGILIDGNKFGVNKSTVKEILLKQYGIDTRDFFYPMNMQPAVLNHKLIKKQEKFPVSLKLYNNGLYLPSSPCLRKSDIKYITDSIKKIAIKSI